VTAGHWIASGGWMARGYEEAMNPVEHLSEYELRNLPAHLAAGGRERELRELLTLEWGEVEEVAKARRGFGKLLDRLRGPRTVIRSRYRNAWQDAKEACGLTDSYLADLDLALRTAAKAAERELAAGEHAPSLGDEVRYVAMATSLNELAGRVPPGVAAALVAKAVWTPIQGVSYARRITVAEERAGVLVALAGALDGELQEQVVDEALHALREVDQTPQWITLKRLAPHLSARAARTVVGTFGDAPDAPSILAEVAARLAELGLVEEALDVAAIVGHERNRADALIAIAPKLERDDWPRAVEIAEAIAYESWRYEALGALYARGLAFDRVAEMLDALAALPLHLRAEALARAAEHASGDAREKVLGLARALEDPNDHAKALAGVVRAAEEPVRSRLVEELLGLLPDIWEHHRELVLVEIAPRVDGPLVNEALRVARGSPAATLALARRLPESERLAVVRAEVARARRGRDPLGALLPAGWAAFEPAEALEAASTAGNRAAAYEEIAPELPPELLSQALSTLLAVPDQELEVRTVGGREPGRAMARLVGELAAFEGEEALDRIRSIADEAFRAEALAAAAPKLSERLVGDALDAALAMRSQEARVGALGALAPRLSPERRAEALAGGRGDLERLFGDAVEAFAPHLTEAELEHVLRDVERMGDGAWRGWAVVHLAPWLPERLLDTALEVAGRVESEYQQVEAVLAVACSLAACGRTADALARVEATWRAMEGEPARSPDEWADRALGDLAPYLDGSDLQRASQLAEAHGLLRAQAALAGALDGERRSELVAALRSQALQTEEPGGEPRVDVLAALGPWLAERDLHETIKQTSSPELVRAFAPYLPHAMIAEAAAATRTARAEDRRFALVTLAERAEGDTRRALAAEALDAGLGGLTSTEPPRWADDICALLRTIPPLDAHALLATRLHARAQGTRFQLMAFLRGLAPELARLGGPKTLRRAASAVEDSVRWWL
jgi:hypothetical protein